MFIFHLVGSDVACTQGCSSPLGHLQSLGYLLHDVRLLGTWVRLQPLAFVNAAVVSGLQHRAFCVFTVCLFHTVSNSSYTQSGVFGPWLWFPEGMATGCPLREGAPDVPVALWQELLTGALLVLSLGLTLSQTCEDTCELQVPHLHTYCVTDQGSWPP